jgi:hypothetical protein
MARTVASITYNRLPEIIRRLPRAANEVVDQTLSAVEGHIKTDMAAAKSGAWYGDHQASAPGEAPAIDTTNLVNSIQRTEVQNGSGSVYTNSEVGEIMEYGAPAANIEPRPFMTPAADAARPEFMRQMRDLESLL